MSSILGGLGAALAKIASKVRGMSYIDKELIEELKKCNPKAIVVYSDYDRGSDSWEDCEVDGVDELMGELYQRERYFASYLKKEGNGDIVHLR